jgi:hypothetical protein
VPGAGARAPFRIGDLVGEHLGRVGVAARGWRNRAEAIVGSIWFCSTKHPRVRASDTVGGPDGGRGP